MNIRTEKRNRLYVWGIVPSILLLVFATKVLLMFGAQSGGESAYSAQRYDDARSEFAGNRTLNAIERWRAPFNEGDARFGSEDYDRAIMDFEAALKHAPADQRCVIRVNIALAHEEIGDAAKEDQNTLAAIEAWRAGREVLAEGECDTEDSRSTDERLEQKVRSEDADEKKQKPQKKKQKPDPERERKKEKLKERNAEGQAERKDSQELEDYPYQPDQPEYSW
ncbi:MAG: hypothetical protein L0H93_03950 [Nocardioides sp.]|nr:hypothetical protein [Nocardioides sp.]